MWLLVRKFSKTESIKTWEYEAEEISTENFWQAKAKMARAKSNYAKAKGIRNVADIKDAGRHEGYLPYKQPM